MRTDAVIGVIRKYGWTDIRTYAVSLARCGFDGDKILFVENISLEARENLLRLGFWLVDFDSPEIIRDKNTTSSDGDALAWGFFGRWRWTPINEFLAKHSDRYRYIIFCDTRDVMFQTDPSVWLEENLKAPYKLVAAGEGWIVRDEPHNMVWLNAMGQEILENLADMEVLCSGTFAGEAETMRKVFYDFITLHNKITNPRAFDQGFWNFLARVTHRDVLYVPKSSEGFVATSWNGKQFYPKAYTVDTPPIFNLEDHVVYAPETGEPFCIVHQYDREVNWRATIDQIMAEADLYVPTPDGNPIILIGSCKAWRTDGTNDAVRDTWVKQWGHLVEYRFVLGRGCENPRSDELILDVDDSYEAYPAKVQAACRWATANGYAHRFICGADTYVIVPRLLGSGFREHDYVGCFIQDDHRLCNTRNILFAQGGAGYWLSPRASAVVETATIPDWVKFADDVFVGNALYEAGVPFQHDPGYFPRCLPESAIPLMDWSGFQWKTFHLSKWRGEPKYSTEWMHETHRQWKDTK